LQILCFALKNDDNLKSYQKMLILKLNLMYYKLIFFQYIMYIIPHLYVVKHFWSFEILNFQMYILWIFKVLELHIFEIVNDFLMCLIVYYRLIFFTINLFLLYESLVSRTKKLITILKHTYCNGLIRSCGLKIYYTTH